jgi:hypothetical protein
MASDDILCFSQSTNNFVSIRSKFHALLANQTPTLNKQGFPKGGLAFGYHLSTSKYADVKFSQVANPTKCYLLFAKHHEPFAGDSLELARIKDNNHQADKCAEAYSEARQWWEEHIDQQLKDWLDAYPYPDKPPHCPLGRSGIALSSLLSILEERYLILSQAALIDIKATLAIPISNLSDFPVIMAAWVTSFDALSANNQPESELSKVTLLNLAIQSSPVLCVTYQQYLALNPLLSDRTFLKAVTYMSTQLANNISTTVPIGQTVHAVAVPTMDPTLSEQVRILVAAALAAASPAVPSNRFTGRTGKAKPIPLATGQSNAGPKRDRPIGTPGYCWYHGTGSHLGSQCICMSTAKGFTDAHRKATYGVSIGGVVGHK